MPSWTSEQRSSTGPLAVLASKVTWKPPVTSFARTTAGVKKVVRVFEYVEIREAQRLDNRPAEEAKPKPAEPK